MATKKTAQRTQKILDALDALYPNVVCELTHSSPWELLVATILSAQCTDARVNMVTPGLFRKYRRIEDFANVPPAELGEDIRPTGFYNNKAKNIIGAAQTVLRDFGGQVPRTMDELLTIPGVARKTANVVLGTSFGIAVGIVVDTHMARLAQRLELSNNSDPVKIEQDLMAKVPQEKWILFSHQVIHHGRYLCVARKPKCAECPMESFCRAPDKTV